MLLYVMERNNMIRRALLLFAALMGGAQKLKNIEEHIGDILHMVDPEEIKKRTVDKQKIYEAWTKMEPFNVQKQMTPDEMLKRAHQTQRQRAATARFAQLKTKDSLLQEV